ncbi:mechanosensitive ion channel [Prolixibacteraceae bacterium JC049]|nr:mechanosensitive ion channel [Prolixibacteraceae bacterium JC049]
MTQLSEYIAQNIGISAEIQTKLLLSLIVILSFGIIRFIVLKIVWKRTEEVRIRYAWKTSLSYVLTFLGVVIIASIWIDAIGEVGEFLGLLTAGLAIALKEPLTNIAGWLFLVFRKPFTVGDRIQIGEKAGDVIDIRLFQFTLLEIGNWVDADQSTGRIIHVPNGKIFNESQANYSKGFQYIWHEIPVTVTFESDWKKAKQLLQEIIKEEAQSIEKEAQQRIIEASKSYLIQYKYLTPTVYTKVIDFGVTLTIRYLTDPRKRRGSEQAIWEKVLDQFNQHEEIDLAYPTTRFYSTE